MVDQSKKIIEFLLKKIPKHSNDIVALASVNFGVTRTTIHRHLATLLKEGKIVKSGATRDTQYFLSTTLDRLYSYKITHTLFEYEVFNKDFEPVLIHFPENIRDIITYCFTEIFNNAIDHSFGTKIIATLIFEKDEIVLTIQDNGIGLFESLNKYFSLDDLREGVLQLTKGKMTTDPSNHTGAGIFFTSRAMDVFEIFANNLHYIRNNSENDWAIETLARKTVGSKITMRIKKDTPRHLTTLFKRYLDEETLAFDKTEIIVNMSKWGEETMISRSQAKRILRGLEKFKKVTLDFKNVRLVGQGFVDEIFRVFINKFPDLKMDYINANSDIIFMITRGKNF